MKKIYKKVVILAALAIIAGYNVYTSRPTKDMTELMLMNVEALANDESGSSNSWDCWSSQKPGYGYYRCGVPCVWVDNFSGDGNASKCFR